MEDTESTGRCVITVSGWGASGLWKNLERTGKLQNQGLDGQDLNPWKESGHTEWVSKEGRAFCNAPLPSPRHHRFFPLVLFSKPTETSSLQKILA